MIAAKTVFRLFALVAFIAVLPPLAHAAEPIALRVVFVQTDNSSAYLAEIEKGKALMKKLDVPAQLRVWKARFAGNDAGGIVVAIEYPNLTELAKAEAKLNADADYVAWLKGLDKVRKVVGDSIYYELKP